MEKAKMPGEDMSLDKNTEVTILMNGREEKIPLEDYLDIKAYEYGFDSYEELRQAGYRIEIPHQEKHKKQKTVER